MTRGKLPPLGSGQRFASLENKLAQRGVRNPAALAASIGRKKLGSARFNQLAQRGRGRGLKGYPDPGTRSPLLPTEPTLQGQINRSKRRQRFKQRQQHELHNPNFGGPTNPGQVYPA